MYCVLRRIWSKLAGLESFGKQRDGLSDSAVQQILQVLGAVSSPPRVGLFHPTGSHLRVLQLLSQKLSLPALEFVQFPESFQLPFDAFRVLLCLLAIEFPLFEPIVLPPDFLTEGTGLVVLYGLMRGDMGGDGLAKECVDLMIDGFEAIDVHYLNVTTGLRICRYWVRVGCVWRNSGVWWCANCQCVQQMQKWVLSICALVVCVRGLHLSADPAALYFEDEFTQINTQVDYVVRTLDLNDSVKFEFLIDRSKQVKTGLNSLHRALLKNNLLLARERPTCPGLSSFNRTELRRYIAYIEDKEWTIVNYLPTCIDCKFIESDVNEMVDLTENYLGFINATLDGKYCDRPALQERAVGLVNLNLSLFKPNLQARNWYYGSTTPSDYKIYMFKRASTYNLTTCPLETPYVNPNDNFCFDCPEGSMFNLGRQKCDICALNQILNVARGKCDLCLGEKRLVNGTLECEPCLIALGQLFNASSGHCYTCGNGSYLDTEQLKCVVIDCPQSTPRFNLETKLCETCGISEIVEKSDPTKCVKTNYVGMCPPGTPFYNRAKLECQACPARTTYDPSTNSCQSVP